MKESDAVGRLLKKLAEVMPGGVGFKHFDLVTAGVPDISWTWARRTAWIEVKLDTTEPRPVQDVVMQRLGMQGTALYVAFFTTSETGSHTLVMSSRRERLQRYSGLDYISAAGFIRKVLEAKRA